MQSNKEESAIIQIKNTLPMKIKLEKLIHINYQREYSIEIHNIQDFSLKKSIFYSKKRHFSKI